MGRVYRRKTNKDKRQNRFGGCRRRRGVLCVAPGGPLVGIGSRLTYSVIPMARVLVVDDEPQMRSLVCQALERHGHSIDQASDGREALQCFAKQQPDLMITDLIMPGMEGIETILTFHRRWPALPIIAISGGGRIGPEDYLSMALQMGANRAFSKPVRLEALVSAVGELISAVP